MVKFSDDLDVETIYEIELRRGRYHCQCFQGNKETCRHREMLAIFIDQKQVDTGLLYDYDTGLWESALS